MKFRFIITLLFLTASYSVWALGGDSTRKAIRKQRPSNIRVTMGLSPTNFRDFSTSPLVYRAPLTFYAALGYEREDSLRYVDMGLDFSRGIAFSSINDHVDRSTFYRMSAYYARLYTIPSIDLKAWHLKVGGMANLTGNFRLNQSLGNNANGLEMIGTLFASAKISRDISRTTEKNKKFLFIKYKLKPLKRAFDYQLNIGVLNTNFRNGYAYIGQSELTESPSTFDDYSLRVNGFRMNTRLRYTRYLPNGNGLQFSYTWDAYYTGDDPEKFEMAQHILGVSLLFNTKK